MQVFERTEADVCDVKEEERSKGETIDSYMSAYGDLFIAKYISLH